jgi:hypothetical protein
MMLVIFYLPIIFLGALVMSLAATFLDDLDEKK